MMSLTWLTESSTSPSLAAVSDGTLFGAACCAGKAVPDTVLTHPDNRTDAATTTAKVRPRVAVPVMVTGYEAPILASIRLATATASAAPSPVLPAASVISTSATQSDATPSAR